MFTRLKAFTPLRALAIAAALILTTTMASCGNSTDGEPGGESDSITIGIKFDQPGLGQQVGNDYEGFDVDVARYIANELGYSNIEFVQAQTPQRETMIESGQVTMIVASYSITDDRKERVSFAGPYFIAGQDLLVRSDETSITGPEDLAGKKLCSVRGSTSAENLNNDYVDGGAQLQEYDSYSKCAEALASGAIDVFSTDNTILAGYAAQEQYQGQFKVVGNTFSEERYGVGIKKGDVELCEDINAAITKMIEDGEWQKAVDKHFGAANFEPDMSVNPPTPDACS